jgi:hypothetical protein
LGRDLARHLRPAATVRWVEQASREQLARKPSLPFLLVRLDDPRGELAQALEQDAAGGARVEAGMGFHTISSAPPPRGASVRPPPPSFGADQLTVRLIRAPHFIVLLGKRADAGKAFTERVSVGRARNNDVVLRHESVSKFHAWFVRDEGDVYYVADASSHNGTTLNGTSLVGGSPTRVNNGDVIRFGGVEITYCEPATLHAALRA